MSAEVETKNASIDTLSVTIQALHVSGKQMTLAVFRQLPLGLAYTSAGEVNSFDFWGKVLYKIKDDGELWAVGSCGGALFRCDINNTGRDQSRIKEVIDCVEIAMNYKKAHEEYVSGGSRNYPNRPGYPCNRYVDLSNQDLEELAAENHDLYERSIRISESRKKLLNLPQLFISV